MTPLHYLRAKSNNRKCKVKGGAEILDAVDFHGRNFYESLVLFMIITFYFLVLFTIYCISLKAVFHDECAWCLSKTFLLSGGNDITLMHYLKDFWKSV